MLYNSDKTNLHSFILGSPFSLIFCLYNEGHLFILGKYSAEAIYLKRSFWDASICIYNYVVKRKGRK